MKVKVWYNEDGINRIGELVINGQVDEEEIDVLAKAAYGNGVFDWEIINFKEK